MSMSLTTEDLLAITKIVRQVVDETVNEAVDALAIQTANGFAAVDERFKLVDERFKSIDKRFESMDMRFDNLDRKFDHLADRLDNHDKRISRLEKPNKKPALSKH